MDAPTLIAQLQTLVPGVAFSEVPAPDCATLTVPRDAIVETLRALRDAPSLGYSLLSELTAVDYFPREPRYEVVYQLVCLGVRDFPRPGAALAPARVRLKVALPAASPSLPTATGLFLSADWAEREVYDLFGIAFEGHPDLRRILMPDEWEGHPLRKDYPVQVNVPVRSSALLQMSEEEFVENIQRLRVHPTARRKPAGS